MSEEEGGPQTETGEAKVPSLNFWFRAFCDKTFATICHKTFPPPAKVYFFTLWFSDQICVSVATVCSSNFVVL